jgi:hypothetical protein
MQKIIFLIFISELGAVSTVSRNYFHKQAATLERKKAHKKFTIV